MLNDMVLRASDGELAASDSWRYVLRRQISFFGEEVGFKGLLEWIGEENPFFERLVSLAGSFDTANPRKGLQWEPCCYLGTVRILFQKLSSID